MTHKFAYIALIVWLCVVINFFQNLAKQNTLWKPFMNVYDI